MQSKGGRISTNVETILLHAWSLNKQQTVSLFENKKRVPGKSYRCIFNDGDYKNIKNKTRENMLWYINEDNVLEKTHASDFE